ncbi:hypothetical protein [Streptomyces sp. NPDC002328]|uniref:hypothetical protein n=1 Tax=Streptomyces sp. NPDC002328 TaxID=3364642 RepID=UPI0036CB8CA5
MGHPGDVTKIGGRILEKLLQKPLDDDLALLVTQVRRLPEDATATWELVTNAIRYGGAPVGLRLIRDQRLLCADSDPSQTQPHLRRTR